MNNTLVQFILNNLKQWTPLSVIVLIVTGGCVFLIVFDSINMIAIPQFIWYIIAALTGGTGVSAAVHSGVTIANGVAKDTATAVVAQVSNNPLPTPNQEVK